MQRRSNQEIESDASEDDSLSVNIDAASCVVVQRNLIVAAPLTISSVAAAAAAGSVAAGEGVVGLKFRFHPSASNQLAVPELVLAPPSICVRLSRNQFVLQPSRGECLLLTLCESVSDSALDVLEVLLEQCSTRVQHQEVVEQLRASAWLDRGYQALNRERRAQRSSSSNSSIRSSRRERRLAIPRRDRREAASEAEAEAFSGAAECISTGGKALSYGIKRGAEFISGGIEFGSTAIKRRIAPCERPLSLPARARSSLAAAQSATGSASLACSFLRSGVENVLCSFVRQAQSVVPGIRLPPDSAASAAVNATCEVLLACQDATNEILESVGDAAVEVIEHKFGGEVGGAVRSGTSALLHIRSMSLQIRRLCLQTIAALTSVPPEEEEEAQAGDELEAVSSESESEIMPYQLIAEGDGNLSSIDRSLR